MNCELCDLVAGNIKTRKYYHDKTCTIVDCLTCGVPMCVLNHHGLADEQEEHLMLAAINDLFEYQSIRTEPRKIQDHTHWHLEGATYLGG